MRCLWHCLCITTQARALLILCSNPTSDLMYQQYASQFRQVFLYHLYSSYGKRSVTISQPPPLPAPEMLNERIHRCYLPDLAFTSPFHGPLAIYYLAFQANFCGEDMNPDDHCWGMCGGGVASHAGGYSVRRKYRSEIPSIAIKTWSAGRNNMHHCLHSDRTIANDYAPCRSVVLLSRDAVVDVIGGLLRRKAKEPYSRPRREPCRIPSGNIPIDKIGSSLQISLATS